MLLQIHDVAFLFSSESDTAVVYRNEQHIGEALKTLLPKYNLKREDIFITSKLSKFSGSHETALGTFRVVVLERGVY